MLNHYSLEFGNLQTLIYTGLARNIGDCKHDEEAVQPAVDFVKSNIDTSLPSSSEKELSSDNRERISMVGLSIQSKIKF